MNSKLCELLDRVGNEIFESLAFILPAWEDEPQDAEENRPRTMALIAFAGPFEGRVALSVPTDMLPEIGANMLGLDFGEVPPVEQQRDALGELLNVICGNLLPDLADADAIFHVQAARILDDAEDAAPDTASAVATAGLNLEGGRVELALFAPAEAVCNGACV